MSSFNLCQTVITFNELFLKKHLLEDVRSCAEKDSVARKLLALTNENSVSEGWILSLNPEVTFEVAFGELGGIVGQY